MIDFNYTAPELLPFRIQEVLDAPNEPHRIGGVVYVPEGGGECEVEYVDEWTGWHCKSCDTLWMGMESQKPSFCMRCGRKVK